MTSIADFNAVNLRGQTVHLKDYAGKVVIVVNTASLCGYTPQYKGLQALYEQYKDQGLVVLGFPCNQFGKQEPGDSAKIGDFCEARFAVKFPLFEKIEVNGAGAHPLYQWLKSEKPGVLGSQSIKWNFTKFLIGRDGKPIKRFATITKPEAMKQAIEQALAA